MKGMMKVVVVLATLCLAGACGGAPRKPSAPGNFIGLSVPDNNLAPGAIIVTGIPDTEDIILCRSGETGVPLGTEAAFVFSDDLRRDVTARAEAGAAKVVEADASYKDKLTVITSYENATVVPSTGFPIWRNFNRPCRESIREYLRQYPRHELSVVTKTISARLIFSFRKDTNAGVDVNAALDKLTPALENASAGVSLERAAGSQLRSEDKVIVAYSKRRWTPPPTSEMDLADCPSSSPGAVVKNPTTQSAPAEALQPEDVPPQMPHDG